MSTATVFANIDEAIPWMVLLCKWVAYLIGVLFLVSAIFTMMKKSSDPRGTPGTAPLASALSGGLLCALGYVAAMVADSMTSSNMGGADVSSYMSYWGSSSGAGGEFITLLKVVQLFGVLGVFRGILMFNDAGRGMGQGGHQSTINHPGISGMVFLFMGGLAINIKQVLIGAAWFFSIPLPSFIS